MAVDTSRLRGSGRRSLGTPPTEGAPGMEEPSITGRGDREEQGITTPDQGRPVMAPNTDASQEHSGQHRRAIDPTGQNDTKDKVSSNQGEGANQAASAARRRVPPPTAEPRIPFTTRIAVSTKERLEDACYHLRIKHQVFIDEAIRLHLERHKF